VCAWWRASRSLDSALGSCHKDNKDDKFIHGQGIRDDRLVGSTMPTAPASPTYSATVSTAASGGSTYWQWMRLFRLLETAVLQVLPRRPASSGVFGRAVLAEGCTSGLTGQWLGQHRLAVLHFFSALRCSQLKTKGKMCAMLPMVLTPREKCARTCLPRVRPEGNECQTSFQFIVRC
jgi:hypothetical protein